MKQNDRELVSGVLALAGGILFISLFLRVPEVGTPFRFLILSLLIPLPLTSLLWACAERLSWIIPPLILVGVVVGTMIDVVLDTKVDRNLFPFEIILYSAMVTPAIVAGSLFGWFLKKKIAR
jgi:hypothetical protein